MGMYSLIEDNVNKFYDIAQNTIGECEHIDEFKNKMQKQFPNARPIITFKEIW